MTTYMMFISYAQSTVKYDFNTMVLLDDLASKLSIRDWYHFYESIRGY